MKKYYLNIWKNKIKPYLRANINTLTHKNKMTYTHITFKGPQLSNVVKTKSSISFDAKYITNDVANIKITRVKKGWVHEDLGMITRLFTDTEYLRWEYEYPKWLVVELKKLKATEYSFTVGMTENAMERMMSDLHASLR